MEIEWHKLLIRYEIYVQLFFFDDTSNIRVVFFLFNQNIIYLLLKAQSNRIEWYKRIIAMYIDTSITY